MAGPCDPATQLQIANCWDGLVPVGAYRHPGVPASNSLGIELQMGEVSIAMCLWGWLIPIQYIR